MVICVNILLTVGDVVNAPMLPATIVHTSSRLLWLSMKLVRAEALARALAPLAIVFSVGCVSVVSNCEVRELLNLVIGKLAQIGYNRLGLALMVVCRILTRCLGSTWPLCDSLSLLPSMTLSALTLSLVSIRRAVWVLLVKAGLLSILRLIRRVRTLVLAPLEASRRRLIRLVSGVDLIVVTLLLVVGVGAGLLSIRTLCRRSNWVNDRVVASGGPGECGDVGGPNWLLLVDSVATGVIILTVRKLDP